MLGEPPLATDQSHKLTRFSIREPPRLVGLEVFDYAAMLTSGYVKWEGSKPDGHRIPQRLRRGSSRPEQHRLPHSVTHAAPIRRAAIRGHAVTDFIQERQTS